MQGTTGTISTGAQSSLDSADVDVRPFDRDGLIPRIRPFAVVAVVAVVAVAVAPPSQLPQALAAGAALTALAIASALLAPWHRLPRSLELVPPLVYVAAVAILRHAGGGAVSGLVTLQALPIVWVALYGNRRQVLVVLAAVGVATIAPIILIGDPEYPFEEWRRLAVDLAVGGLIGFTVEGLTRQIRGHVRVADERANLLAEQEARLRTVHESAYDAIVTLTPEGTIVDVNPAAIRMFGATDSNELVGLDLISTLAPDEVREYLRTGMARLTVARDETTSRQFQTELLRLDGEAFPVDVTVGVVQEHGRYLVHTFARDISERMAVEAVSRRHNTDLEGLLDVAGRLSSPAEHGAVRKRICDAAAALTGATMVTLFEPSAGDLVLTASAGRTSPVDRVSLDSETSAAALVFATGDAYFSGDLEHDPRVARVLAEQAGVRAGFWQPLRGAERLAGVLIVFWDEPIDAMDARTQSLLHLLASQASAALEMGRLVSRLEDLARTDGLTGVANRRTFNEVLGTEVARAARARVPLSLVMLDLDHFKAFNDARGHQAGDQLLIEAAAAWARELRPSDLLCRYGGEEFALILPDCELRLGVRVADRLRRVTPGGQTTSAGVATWREGESPTDLVARADAALYRAKGEGRDRSVAA